MTDPFASRVKETSTTSGTGTLNLAGASTGFISFVAGIGDGNECYYLITDGTDWEIGIGTVTDAATDTLSRDTVKASSNSDAAVDWGSTGTRDVFGSPTSADLFNKLYDGSVGFYTDSGAADAYVITPSPNIQSYKTGQRFRVAIQNANTGAATMNVNSLGNKNIKVQDGSDPAAGAIQASIHTFVFDGTNLVLLDPFDEGLDEKVKVSANDTTAGYVEDKITAGTGINLTTNNDGANEDRQIDVDVGTGANQVVQLDGSGDMPAVPLGNMTGLSALIDALIGSTQGQILYRDSSAWQALAAGTAGQFLKTGGAAANPSWDDAAALTSESGISLSSPSEEFTGLVSPQVIFLSGTFGVVSGTTSLYIELGDSGGYETSGYDSDGAFVGGATTWTDTVAIELFESRTDSFNGNITLVHVGSNEWEISWLGTQGGATINFGSCNKTLSAELDRIKIRSGNANNLTGSARLHYL